MWLARIIFWAASATVQHKVIFDVSLCVTKQGGEGSKGARPAKPGEEATGLGFNSAQSSPPKESAIRTWPAFSHITLQLISQGRLVTQTAALPETHCSFWVSNKPLPKISKIFAVIIIIQNYNRQFHSLCQKKGPNFCSSLLYVLGELPLATGESQENKQPLSAGSSYNRKIIISQLEKP